ncbi:c-type cytochrome [Billgrantia antri]|uniref:Cytochrome c4 n=1 Tax=Billgrantia antri TaxID=2846777 RepID=A0ABS6ZIH7_9GAMM|nr:c-type cytochrome [Halomonas antri]MBW6389745.1 cytochrome c4 [Halomonas antri]
MTTVNSAVRLGLMLGLMAGPAVAQEGDPQRGETAAAVCVACHQANGSGKHIDGAESWPRLAGQNAGYIAKQLQDFKAGRRQNATMQPFANMLDDQQIADVAAYYSQLPVTEAEGGGEADEALLARGEQLALRGDWNAYIVSCKSCHGPGNEGAGSTFPGIASQHAGYIEAQLHAWQANERGNDPQNLMGAIAKRMSDEDIRAVAAWLASQKVTAQ